MSSMKRRSKLDLGRRQAAKFLLALAIPSNAYAEGSSAAGESISARVISVIAERLRKEKLERTESGRRYGETGGEVRLGARIQEDLRIDSLTWCQVIMDLEEEFGAEISDDIAETFRTVDDVVRHIEQVARN